MNELEKFNRKVEEFKVKQSERQREQNERAKERYHYARSKGFSSYESMVLMGKTKAYIDNIALLKNK